MSDTLPGPPEFWNRVDRSSGDCWIWTGAIHSAGYGRIGYNQYAHRVAWELSVGPIPPGHVICHRCDNPPCCNPDHLFAGTQSDNMADCVLKGRHFSPFAGKLQTHCKYGHELVEPNLYWHWKKRDGRYARLCRACKIRRSVAEKQRRSLIRG